MECGLRVLVLKFVPSSLHRLMLLLRRLPSSLHGTDYSRKYTTLYTFWSKGSFVFVLSRLPHVHTRHTRPHGQHKHASDLHHWTMKKFESPGKTGGIYCRNYLTTEIHLLVSTYPQTQQGHRAPAQPANPDCWGVSPPCGRWFSLQHPKAARIASRLGPVLHANTNALDPTLTHPALKYSRIPVLMHGTLAIFRQTTSLKRGTTACMKKTHTLASFLHSAGHHASEKNQAVLLYLPLVKFSWNCKHESSTVTVCTWSHESATSIVRPNSESEIATALSAEYESMKSSSDSAAKSPGTDTCQGLTFVIVAVVVFVVVFVKAGRMKNTT